MNPFDTTERTVADTVVADRVVELLAGYLFPTGPGMWPGADGLTVAEAVGMLYPAEVRAGHLPDQAELVRRHPELADGIVAFFSRGAQTG